MEDHDGPGTVSASWLADPVGRHQYRYWDGVAWTDHVADGGQQSIDPLAASQDALTALRRREAEVEAEIAEVLAEIKKAAESTNDADMANVLLADIEARMHGGSVAGKRSPLTRHTELQEELESIRRQIAEEESGE